MLSSARSTPTDSAPVRTAEADNAAFGVDHTGHADDRAVDQLAATSSIR
jgi:hypothetical protein